MCYIGLVKRAVIRLPSEVLGRLDQLAEQLNAACPGRRFSRAAVARILLTRGLCGVDVEGGVEGGRIGGILLEGEMEGKPRARGRRSR
jgi:hypothetical protein